MRSGNLGDENRIPVTNLIMKLGYFQESAIIMREYTQIATTF
jgi:hypothetical protein